MKAELAEIDKKEGEDKLELVQIFNGFYPIFLKYQHSEKKEFNSLERYDIYSNSLFIITIIEKILRRVAITSNSKIMYYAEADSNLGDILKTKNSDGGDYVNSMLNGMFDNELICTLEYYLGKTSDLNVGKNVRNNLSHNRNIMFSKLTPNLSMRVFYLFLSIVNAIYASYINNSDSFRKAQDSN